MLESPAEPRSPRPSLAVAYDLWLESWESALAAVATAIRNRTLSTSEAAKHQGVIAAERSVVTKQFTLLVGQGMIELGSRDDCL